MKQLLEKRYGRGTCPVRLLPPSGWTGNEELGYAKSIMDYLFRWIELRFLSGKQLPLFTQQIAVVEQQGREEANHAPASVSQYLHDSYEVGDAPLCVHLWVTDGSQRQLPQVRKLWRHERLLVIEARGAVRELCIMSPLFRYVRYVHLPSVH